MPDPNNTNRFEEAFERGQRGHISSYEAWLQDHGIQPDRVTEEFVAHYFQSHPEYAPNHGEHLEEVVEFLGFFSQREGPYHIPVIGVTGIGKTQFLYTLRALLDQLDTDLSYKQYSAATFDDDTDGSESQWDQFLAELAELEKAVILLDDCDGDKRPAYSLETIHKTIDDVFLITAWTPQRWDLERDEITERLPLSTAVDLTPLSESATVEALQTTMVAISTESIELPVELYQRIHKASCGIPGLFHRLFRETLHETFLQQLQLGDLNAVDSAVENLHLENVEEQVYDLSDQKLLILKHILLAQHPQGRRPSELVEVLDRDKSTISYHLQELTTTNILEKEKIGRSVFYQVSEPMKPLIQRRITQEGEFRA